MRRPDGTDFFGPAGGHFRPTPALAGKEVLVVDDSEINLEVIRQMLLADGAEVSVAPDATACIANVLSALHLRQPYDLILMDLCMPGIDGYEAVARLRRLGVATTVVAVTASDALSDLERCLDIDISAVVQKPLRRAMLTKIVRRALGSTTAAAPTTVLDAGSTDEQISGDLLPGYLRALSDYLERLHDARDVGDSTAVRHIVHQLRGSASLFGFTDIALGAETCDDLLRADATMAEAHGTLDALQGAIEKVLESKAHR